MDAFVPTNLILYLMLIVCLILVIVDIIEILKLQNIWNLKASFELDFYQKLNRHASSRYHHQDTLSLYTWNKYSLKNHISHYEETQSAYSYSKV